MLSRVLLFVYYMEMYGIQIYRLFYIYLPQRNGSIVVGCPSTHATRRWDDPNHLQK